MPELIKEEFIPDIHSDNFIRKVAQQMEMNGYLNTFYIVCVKKMETTSLTYNRLPIHQCMWFYLLVYSLIWLVNPSIDAENTNYSSYF